MVARKRLRRRSRARPFRLWHTQATPAQIAGWDIDVRGDDGAGLPPGKGTVDQGAEVYRRAMRRLSWNFRRRRRPLSQARWAATVRSQDDRPEPTVGSYWPFAPTLWDYINRAMPMPAPHTLSADDVYALTAYILNLNDIVPNEFRCRPRQFAESQNAQSRQFHLDTTRGPIRSAKACMNACVDPPDVKIMSTAEGKDLTPRTTGPLDTMQPK